MDSETDAYRFENGKRIVAFDRRRDACWAIEMVISPDGQYQIVDEGPIPV